jgi:hypothetical protein
VIVRPTFVEPVRAPELDDDATGFEFPPDLDMMLEAETRPGRSPFRPDWERSRLASL